MGEGWELLGFPLALSLRAPLLGQEVSGGAGQSRTSVRLT